MATQQKKWVETARRYRTYIKVEKRLSENSVEAYMRDLEQFAHFVLVKWDVPPRKVEREMVERYLEWLYDEGREKSSQARMLSGIRSFFNYLLLNDEIQSSPAEDISAPKTNRTLPDVLTTDEIDRLIASIEVDTVKGRRDRAMIEVLYSCGLRVSELISLRMSDLFFGEGYIRVIGKGNKERLVYFDARTKIHLQNYLSCRADSNPALFVSLKAPYDRLMIGGVETRLRELGKRLNLPKVHPHKFRRTLATSAIDKGMPIEQVQQLLGHQKIDTTMHYAMVKQQNVKLAHRKYIG